jgi:glyoxylase-like metal-dependent hydrolase (beta-lactamase superfamily II)
MTPAIERQLWRERLDDLRSALPAPIREVVPGLYRVRTRGAFAYLAIDEKVTLIDTGAPGSGEEILEAVRTLGRSVDDIANIVITHYHIDHVGGLPEIQTLVPARTGIHLAEAPYIENRLPLPNPFTHPLLARALTPYLEFADPGPARIDVCLQDGDELPALGGLRVVHSPGHTPGSIALHFPERGVLIVGDALQYRFGRMMLPNRLFTQDMDEAVGSIRKLARLDFETLCFGHYRPIVQEGGSALRRFARSLTA